MTTTPQWQLTAKRDMRQYQWKAVKFGLNAPRNAMLLDMGLGKTTITLHIIKALMHKNELGGLPVLIVAPIRVIHNVWRQEAAKWEHTAGLRFSIMHGSARQRLEAFNADVDIMLINPENLGWLMKLLEANGYGTTDAQYDKERTDAENYRKLRWASHGLKTEWGEWRKLVETPEEYAKLLASPKLLASHFEKDYAPKLSKVPDNPWPWSMLVIDESSMFKNSSTKRWKALANARNLFKRVTLLTGTPTPNTMMELWPQMYFLDGGQRLGRTKIMFRDRYFYKHDYMGYDWRLRRGADKLINERVQDVCMRLDAKDWLDMPEVLRNPIAVELPDEIMQQYTRFEDQMFMELLTSTVEAISAASLSQRCHQFANGAMYSTDRETDVRTWEPIHDAKLETLETVVDEAGGNVIIAYQYKHDLERLRQLYPHASVLAGAGTAETKQIIEDWNAGKIRVLLLHPASAGHGLNLQHGGHTIVFFSLTWSLEQHDQLIARLHRSGQTERVVVHYLIAKDTVDDLIYAALQNKARSQQELLDALREYSMRKEAMRAAA